MLQCQAPPGDISEPLSDCDVALPDKALFGPFLGQNQQQIHWPNYASSAGHPTPVASDQAAFRIEDFKFWRKSDAVPWRPDHFLTAAPVKCGLPRQVRVTRIDPQDDHFAQGAPDASTLRHRRRWAGQVDRVGRWRRAACKPYRQYESQGSGSGHLGTVHPGTAQPRLSPSIG